MSKSSEDITKPSEHDLKVDAEIKWHFGGSIGTTFIMVFSHILIYYFWISIEYYNGHIFYPTSTDDVLKYISYVRDGATPTWKALSIYGSFFVFQTILAYIVPGLKIKGLPVPSEGGRKLTYNCNGVQCWYITLIVVAILHYTEVFRLSAVVDNLGPIVTIMVIAGDGLSLLIYVGAYVFKRTHRMNNSIPYDFFMGAWLNPGHAENGFDLKMWAEVRVSWLTLFLLTLSCAVKQYETYGSINAPAYFMVLAHGLYANACVKGEECIPTTWDIFYEKFGWMLIFWNLAGVPFLYSFSSFYILKNHPVVHSTPYLVFCFIALIITYYIWDTANSQKNRFRMQERGTFVDRKTFPQLPWGTLKNPKYIQTKHGNKILADGWYVYARKIHYLMDIFMALLWGMICGWTAFLPYFYCCFFTTFIVHRGYRDMERCRAKYGKDWDEYLKRCPYLLIPFIW